MKTIVPPRRGPIEDRVLRRVKAIRCAKWCVAFTLIGAAAFTVGSVGLLLLGFGACALALVAAIAAVVYRIIEAPRHVTVRRWPRDPPVIHFTRKD